MKNLLFVIHFLLALTITNNLLSQKIYWLDKPQSQSYRMDYALSDLENITPNVSLGDLNDFAIDQPNKKIYYTISKDAFNDGTPGIVRTNLDGSDVEWVVAENFAPSPGKLALDIANRIIYWIDGEYPNVTIRSTNMDGTNQRILITLPRNGSGLEVDPIGKKLYWSEEYTAEFYRMDIDGLGITETIALNSQIGILGFTLDVEERKIYLLFSDGFLGSPPGKIKKVNLDGTDSQEIVEVGNNTLQAIALDKLNKKIYWSFLLEDVIQRANFDGSNKEDFFHAENFISPSSFGDIGEIAFDYNLSNSVNSTRQENIISVFPNPANRKIIANVSNIYTPFSIRVFDITGKQVYTSLSNQAGSDLTILTSDLHPGLYFFEVSTAKNTWTEKVIVRN